MPTISIGQALLILVDNYTNKPLQLNILKKLYLSGVKTESDKVLLQELLKHPALAKYKVATDHHIINEDPSRRYFETVLAFESMKNGLKELNIDDLNKHYKSLYETLLITHRKELDNILSGVENKDTNSAEFEFNDAIIRIHTDKNYVDFTKEDKYKLEKLIKIAYLGVFICSDQNYVIPMNIYWSTEYFLTENRGRIKKEEQNSVVSQQYGILKNYMPVPYNDVGFTEIPFLFPRIADRSAYLPDTKWVNHNFEKLVHPFVSSISGTMLTQLRSFILLKQKQKLCFNKVTKLNSFLKCFTSILLYNSGGHSYYEYFAVLALPTVIKNFKFLPGFKLIDMESVLLKDNVQAFNKALQKTVEYNKMLLKKYYLHQQIQETRFVKIHDEKKIHPPILLKTNFSKLNKNFLEIPFERKHLKESNISLKLYPQSSPWNDNFIETPIERKHLKESSTSLKSYSKLPQLNNNFLEIPLENKYLKESNTLLKPYSELPVNNNIQFTPAPQKVFPFKNTFFKSFIEKIFKKDDGLKVKSNVSSTVVRK